MPFEVPSNWAWTTVNNISKSILYGVSESAKPEGKYKLLRITDIQDNQVNWNTVPFTDFDEYKVGSYILRDGDIVFARTGATVGKSYLIKGLSQKAIYASYLIRVQIYDLIIPEYIKLFFESGYYWQQIQLNSVGIGQPNVNGTILGNLNLPLPPYAEQKRIVAEIERWLSFIDIIEGEKRDLQTIIKQAKSKILYLAIHGKLVPQNPNDEPASELLKRIYPEAKITCDNEHYPVGWIDVILGDIFYHNTGKALNSSNKEGVLRNYLTTSNVYWNQFDLSLVKQMPFRDNELEKCTVQKGDLLVCEGGDIGRSAIWNFDYNICIQNHIHRLRPKGDLNVSFYYYVLRFLKEHNRIGGKGIGLLGLSSNELHKIGMPLPPRKEQDRIVLKIEELFSVFDNIQNALEA